MATGISPRDRLLNKNEKLKTFNLMVPNELKRSKSPRTERRNLSNEPPRDDDPLTATEREDLRKNCADIRAEYMSLKGNIEE